MKIIKCTIDNEKQIIETVKQALFNEELVILPTDTVYGIMALASNIKAVEKLYQAKKRSMDKPTALLVHSKEAAKNLLGNDIVTTLADKFWPGPLTIIGQAKQRHLGWSRIGVRIPDEPLLLKVLESVDEPLMASSANITGDKPPKQLNDISQEIVEKVALAIDSGPTRLLEESTVINIENKEVILLRQGPISLREIKEVINI